MNKRGREILKLNFAVLLAGATGLFGRTISLSEIPLVWYRMLFAIIVLAVMMAVGRRLHLPPLGQTMKILGCGFVLAIHWVLFYGSIKESNVSVGVICFATASFFTALLEPMVNRHRPRWKQLLFSSISLVGIMMVFSLDTRYRLGIAMGLASAALYSLFSIFNKNVAQQTGQGSSTMLLYELIGGALVLTLLMPFYHILFPGMPVVPDRNDLLMLLLLASVVTIWPMFLQIQVLKTLSPFLVNITYNLESVYSIFFAMLLFNESRELSLSFWLGVALVVLSVFLEIFSRREESEKESQVPEGNAD